MFVPVVGAIAILGKSDKQNRVEKRKKDLAQHEKVREKIAKQNERNEASGGKIVASPNVLDKKEMQKSKMKALQAKRANARGGPVSASLVSVTRVPPTLLASA